MFSFDDVYLFMFGSFLLFACVLWRHSWATSPFSHLPLPPSRKGYPIIGNLLEIPRQFEWKTFHEWSKELDTDILCVKMLGTTLIVLDTPEVATDLLERRSSKYSGRPRMPMVNELMGWDFNLGLMQYGARWKRHRRLMHSSFNPTAVLRFRPKLVKAARNFLARFLVDPEVVVGNARYMASEAVISITYGLEVQPKDDPYIAIAEEGVQPLSIAAVPGAFLVDTIPILKYVPEWMPGAGFKRKAREWTQLSRRMVEEPFSATKKLMTEGVCPSSFVSDSLLNTQGVADRDKKIRENDIQEVAGTMYAAFSAAGTDTTSSIVASCILGLLEKPEVLKKAQQQLDSVVKPGDLPDFEDEASLPYITAICKEALRWRDVAPTAVPHLLMEDDEYKGYRIPKGSIVIPNVWAMLHNEDVYPDPFAFNPERFLNEDGTLNNSARDPGHACWGFGYVQAGTWPSLKSGLQSPFY
ncbi:hypothetical protein D9613_008324 [Agrocybe pediades]|uniref:Cytochrome P450 n=1 Tax=Agrocybe pediades TaxID=84607 RepID=A0A8H4QTG6_9AGAR|nr:hypothetical protein D9613_008324 [Agrocybe pediades]